METLYLFVAVLVGGSIIYYLNPESFWEIISPFISNIIECYKAVREWETNTSPKNSLFDNFGKNNIQKNHELSSRLRLTVKNKFLGIYLHVDRLKNKNHTKESTKNENNTIMEKRQEKSSPADAEEH